MGSQTPFLTVCMYLNEVSTDEDKQYLADIIEEVLKQRIQCMKDRYGNWVAPAFPKLIYMLYVCIQIVGYKNHWDDGYEVAINILNKVNEYCKQWSVEDNMAYGVYGTPRISWEN